MSETPKKGIAMPAIDAVLRDWPDAQKSADDGEARVERVMTRIKAGEHGATAMYVSNDDLFADPLGVSEEDSHNAALPGASVSHPTPATPRGPGARVPAGEREGIKMNSFDRERDRKSLQDLAKMAQGLTPPPSSVAAPFSAVPSSTNVDANKKADDSGIVDLAAASKADPHATVRAQSTPLASHSLFEDAPRPASVPPMQAHQYQQPAPSVPPPSVHPASVPPQSSAAGAYGNVRPIGASLAPRKQSNAGGIVLAFGGLLAMAGVAAGGFLYVRSHKPAPAPVVATAQPVAPTTAADPVAAPAPTVADNAAPVNAGTNLDSLPAVGQTAPAASTHHRRRVASAAVAGGNDGDDDDSKTALAAKPDNKVADKLMGGQAAPAAPAGPPGDLGAAMKGAVGDDNTEKKPAAASNGSASMGNVPQKPSQGAVTGALGAVLPSARACLGPDDPISRASVVFSSDGSVSTVTVSGGAVGKPAESCIKDKLKSAKLQPFAEPTYTANITIRHN